MSMGQRARRVSTIAGAIIFFSIISVAAARLVFSHDLLEQNKAQVTRGAEIFGEYWISRKKQIELSVTQAAAQGTLRKNLQARDAAALRRQLSDIAGASNLSFLTVVDVGGDVVARANGSRKGSLSENPLIYHALADNATSTATLLDASF